MNKPPKISIPNPCTENWTAMKPDEKGRYCSACQTSVRDFTSFSDTELISFFQQTQIPACGRFAQRQLEVLNSHDKPNANIVKLISKYAAAALIGAAILPQNSSAQETIIQDKQSEISKEPLPDIKGGSTEVRGTVTDKNGEPVIACAITLQGSDVNTLSDEYGRFAIPVPDVQKNLVELTFENIGYVVKVVRLTDYKDLHVIWDALAEIEIQGVLIYQKPTLWQRITRPFKRLF